jgi:hypothetical protein
MKVHDAIEERTGNCRSCVRLAKQDEVCVLGEKVDDGEDDRFDVDAWEPHHKILGGINPN